MERSKSLVLKVGGFDVPLATEFENGGPKPWGRGAAGKGPKIFERECLGKTMIKLCGQP